MALDMNKLKAAHQQLQAKMSRGGGAPMAKWWRPGDGENKVRILPGWTNEGDFAGQFWREVAQHWGVSETSPGPVLCPRKTPGLNADCPICEFVDQLKMMKDDVAAQELAKDLRAKTAYLLSIVDLKDPVYTAADVAEWQKSRPDSEVPFKVKDVKIQVYAATQTIFEQIMSVILQNDLDITDRETGHNVIITKVPNKDKMKTRYTIVPDLKKTAAPITEETVLPDLAKIGQVKEYNDMMKLLSEGKGGTFAGLLPANAGSTTASSTVKAAPAVEHKSASTNDGEDLAASLRRALND